MGSRAFVLVLAIALHAQVATASFDGCVVGVSDGDTITVLVNGHDQVKVRLVEIDAPEKKQPFGQRAKQELSDLVYDRTVRVDDKGTDKYKRTLGRVYAGSVDVNLEMVRRGFAWRYVRYSEDPAIAAAEESARSARRGLWVDAEPVAPWEWRRQQQPERNSKY